MTLTVDQNHLIEKIASENNFVNYTVDIEDGSKRGDNYLGIIYMVTIKEDDRQLDLIVKVAITNEKVRQVTPLRKAYVNEINVYRSVFPALESNVPKCSLFGGYPKCYGLIDDELEETIVLENMKVQGFSLWDRFVSMDQRHIAEVFQKYGNFHANSYILKKRNPKKFDEFAKTLQNPFWSSTPKNHDAEFNTCFSGPLLAVKDDEKLYPRLKAFADNSLEYFQKDIKDESDFKVILHGDAWCNNFLFKHEDPNDPNNPTDVCLIDWQLSSVGSPIWDLSYFYYSSGSKESLEKFDYFIEEYHKSFRETLKNSGFDDDFPLEEIRKQWKKHSKYGLFCTAMVLRVMLFETSEAPDMTETVESNKTMVDFFSMDINNISLYNRRIKDVIEFMIDRDFL